MKKTLVWTRVREADPAWSFPTAIPQCTSFSLKNRSKSTVKPLFVRESSRLGHLVEFCINQIFLEGVLGDREFVKPGCALVRAVLVATKRQTLLGRAGGSYRSPRRFFCRDSWAEVVCPFPIGQTGNTLTTKMVLSNFDHSPAPWHALWAALLF